jgi:hypothetical protein
VGNAMYLVVGAMVKVQRTFKKGQLYDAANQLCTLVMT